ncbi:MAG: 50S ribosomal protein L10 [Clostridia bacterium]|nr:50S ribosomal protein L10 [Clostridia bacterium]
MPSQVVLEAKKQQVAAIAEGIKAACAGVIVDYSGITVADDTVLRKELREAGVSYKVVKNTLLKLALDGTGLEELDSVLSGTTAIASSADDYTAAARILDKFASTHKNFTIKGGFLDGEVISLEKVDALAKLPTREVLLTQVACVFQAPMAAFARVVKAVMEKKEEGGDAAPAAQEEAPAAEAAPAEVAAEAPAETPAE